MIKKPKEQMQFICSIKEEQLGVVDITELLHKACKSCPNSDFSVKVHRMYSNDTICEACVQVVCSKNATCNYIMELMKCDEQVNSPT